VSGGSAELASVTAAWSETSVSWAKSILTGYLNAD
jgi:hypothetical protein